MFAAVLGGGTDCESSRNVGAGIAVCGFGTNPTVERCRFLESEKGAGIWVYGGAAGTFTNCESLGNAGQGICVDGSTAGPTVERCRFADGKGAGILINEGGGRFTDCEITGNDGGGIAAAGSGVNLMVERCRLAGERYAGIFLYEGALGTFTDCEITGFATGICLQDCGTNPAVKRCRFTDGKEDGILVECGAAGTFTDCESSRNAGAGIYAVGSAEELTVTGAGAGTIAEQGFIRRRLGGLSEIIKLPEIPRRGTLRKSAGLFVRGTCRIGEAAELRGREMCMGMEENCDFSLLWEGKGIVWDFGELTSF